MKQFLLTILAAVSLFFPVGIVHAQVVNVPVCAYIASPPNATFQYAAFKGATDYECPITGYAPMIMLDEPEAQGYKGLCYTNQNGFSWDFPVDSGPPSNVLTCPSSTPNLVLKSAIKPQGSPPPGGGGGGGGGTPTPTPPIGTPTPPNGGGGSGGGSGGGGSGGGGSGGGTPPANPPTTRGDCDEKFHQEGPLCVPDNPFDKGVAGSGDIKVLAFNVIKYLLYFAGIIAVIMSIIGGYYIMTAAGDATQAANGRKTLTNAIIGLIIVVMSYAIIQAVLKFLTS